MKFAIYETGAPTDFCRENYGDYPHLFADLIGEPGAIFDAFTSQNLEFPEDPAAYDGIIVTGSAADAHADEPWVHQLNASIRAAYDAGCKIFGACFGHQAVANALGGRTGRNPDGWEVGVHAMDLSPSFYDLPYVHISPDQPLRILEVHQDHVIDMPPGAVLHGSTPNTRVQVYTLGDQVFCMQGHPEFFNPIVADLVEARVANGRIPKDTGAAAMASFRHEADRDDLQRMIKAFLYGPAK